METIKREPKMIIKTGAKGIGKSHYIENNYKDYFKIETGNRNRQDKLILGRVLEASKINDKILIKTHANYLKNKFNSNSIMKKSGISLAIIIEDIGKQLIINKKRKKNNINRFDLKNTEVYRLIKK